ncbi:hypothetical protein [Actinomadura sp. RB99]|uniref:hypothetical protein n=1 Tax=Actinomadura sp. RB99 TaxID=2691577 RepID=UPI0019D5ACCC|nr:hypothetical protein [Actinomadura sp. RB99]
MIGRRLAPAGLLRDFHRAYPAIPLDVVPLFDADAALAPIASGTIDASVRALTAPDRLPAALDSTRVLDEPVQLVTGPPTRSPPPAPSAPPTSPDTGSGCPASSRHRVGLLLRRPRHRPRRPPLRP